jgi:hypothetical protein
MTHEEIVQLLAETVQRAKSNSHRIDELSSSVVALNKMATALEVLATKQNAMSDMIDRIDRKVTVLEKAPAKRVYTALGYVASALCSAAAGALLTNIF